MKHRTNDWQALANAMEKDLSWDTNGALGAGPRGFPTTDTGRLPSEFEASVRNASYIVWSYETPIAWKNAYGEWVQPDTKYSPTTTQHQHTARMAIAKIKGEF